MRTLLCRIIGISVLFFVSLLGAGTPKAMIIFDASGSMWGQIDGVNKIVIARDALKSVVGKWNPDVQLGLTVYGHRVKGDCNDIETIIPIGSVHKKQMIDTVMGILPKGMTPIAKSLRQVADSLRRYEDQTTIILISDGRESCDADPCATAKQLKAEGINFVAHVIGFNVNAATDRQLACIAHATGGEYFSAKNAAALNQAIKVIAKKVEKPKPKPKPAIEKTTLKLIARFGMSPDGLNVSGMQWKATQNGQTLYSGTDEAPEIPAKVGKAHIEAVYARTSDVQEVAGDITLQPKQSNPVMIKLKSAKVIIDTAEEEGGPRVKSSVHIYPILGGKSDTMNEFGRCIPTASKACERILPTGDFLIEATYNGMKAQKRIKLSNKETKTIHLYFKQTGKVFVSASETEGGKWINAYCDLYDADKSHSWNIYPKKRESSISYKQVPVGKYTLNCRYNHFEKKDIPVEVKAGETTKVHVVFAPFHISAKGIHPCALVHYEILSAKGRLVTEKDAPAKKGFDFVVPDGTYFVEATAGGATKKRKIMIGSESTVSSLVIDFGGNERQKSIEGVWKTSEGKATIHTNGTKVHGTYDTDNGELIGEMTYPQKFEGFWIEDRSNTKCTQAKNGRFYWGKVFWEFEDDMCSFKGKWSYCDQKPSRAWRGTFIKPLPKETSHEILKPGSSQNPTPSKATPKPVQQNIQDLSQAAEAITQTVSAHKDDLKKVGDLLNALGGLMGGKQQQTASAPSTPKNDTELNISDDDLQLFSQ